MVKSLSTIFYLYRKKIAVRAAKYPNVFRRPYGILVEGKSSTTRFILSCRLENKGGNPEYLQQ